jgi:hypothetical protein
MVMILQDLTTCPVTHSDDHRRESGVALGIWPGGELPRWWCRPYQLGSDPGEPSHQAHAPSKNHSFRGRVSAVQVGFSRLAVWRILQRLTEIAVETLRLDAARKMRESPPPAKARGQVVA